MIGGVAFIELQDVVLVGWAGSKACRLTALGPVRVPYHQGFRLFVLQLWMANVGLKTEYLL